MPSVPETSTSSAVQAMKRGWVPIPIADGGKRPYGSSWTHLRWESVEQVEASFDAWATQGASGVGLLLGEPSGGLIDIDLDHPKSLRLRDHFLPPSPMQTGRSGRPRSHRWYIAEGEIPATRRYKMPDGSVSVELRSTGSQTVIPPSVHPSGEMYRWEGTAWGGRKGPAKIDGKKLSIQVALLGMGAVLLENWPAKGGRHEAYLALAGGLLRYGESTHPYWSRNLAVIIESIADVTRDEDGPETRVAEVMGSTLSRLREGGMVTGFPRLGEIIGVDHAEQVRRMAKEVESLSGFIAGQVPATMQTINDVALPTTLPPEVRNPMAERLSSWSSVDLEPYLNNEVVLPEATLLLRDDGKGLMYGGRVNLLFGLSESGKTWVAMKAAVQELGKGERVLYIDLEDEPSGILDRFRVLGLGDDDIKNQLRYVHPEDPLADMQRYKFGASETDEGKRNTSIFRELLAAYDPTLIILDGLNELYGLHGHDTNDATGSTIVAGWIRTLTRGGRTGVIVIDHTAKSGGAGASPIGAHHKIAMTQGTAIRVDMLKRPMRGDVGAMKLIVYKDRLSAVRSISTKQTEQVAGIVEIDSRDPHRTLLSIAAPDENDVYLADSHEGRRRFEALENSEKLQTAILAQFDGDLDKELKTADIKNLTAATDKEIYDAWAMLEIRGVVIREGETRWTRYRLNPNNEID